MDASFNRSLPRGGVASLFGLSSLLLAPLLASCGGSSTAPEWPKGNVVIRAENNYTSMTMLHPPTLETASGADLMVCWDGLMKDLLCHDIVSPDNDIDNVSFLKIQNLTHAQVEAKLAVGTLEEALVTIYRDYHTSKSPTSKCANLSQFVLGTSILDPAVDHVEPAAGKIITYMLLFETGEVPGVGSRAMTFIEPKVSNTTTLTVNAPDACSGQILDFMATLGAPLTIPKDDPTKWHYDWSQITKDSFGNPVDFKKIDNVLLGFYQGMTADQLQANFKDIELIATALYEVGVKPGARDAMLGDMKERTTGAAFPGFTQTDGIWAVAVTCSMCQVPAPISLSILQPQ